MGATKMNAFGVGDALSGDMGVKSVQSGQTRIPVNMVNLRPADSLSYFQRPFTEKSASLRHIHQYHSLIECLMSN